MLNHEEHRPGEKIHLLRHQTVAPQAILSNLLHSRQGSQLRKQESTTCDIIGIRLPETPPSNSLSYIAQRLIAIKRFAIARTALRAHQADGLAYHYPFRSTNSIRKRLPFIHIAAGQEYGWQLTSLRECGGPGTSCGPCMPCSSSDNRMGNIFRKLHVYDREKRNRS